MVSKSYHAEIVLENTYFVFYMFYNAFQKLLPVDATNKKVYWNSCILVPGFYNVQLDKAKSEGKIVLVIKTIDLITYGTLFSLLCV